jgi:transmembrane sensor
MSNPTIVAIIEKYSTGALSSEEAALLDDWLASVSPAVFHQTLNQCVVLPAGLKDYPAIPREFAQALETAINEADDQDKMIRLFPWKKWTAVAAAVVLLSAGAWFLARHHTNPGISLARTGDIAPGARGAILTLSDGKQIVLDSTGNAFSTTEGNAKITRGGKDLLTYKLAAGSPSALVGTVLLYNTLTTPRGRKISLVLADGTKVWLNAASSIKYPTAFTAKDRVVEIRGEAYFEVAANAAKPFVVKKMGSDYSVLVLGTHFDMNAYDDEETIKTTLLEGAVKIEKGAISHTLKPGEQAIAQKDQGSIDILSSANIAEVMAWKNDLFNFERADIYSVMRQIARWYDVEVEYKGTIARHFGGTISQDVNVSQVFKMLEQTGAVKFTIEGRKVIVLPQ